MTLSTISVALLATPFATSLLDLTIDLLPLIGQLGLRIVRFRSGPITPATTHAYELDLHALLQEIGRVILQWTVNHLESEELSPALVDFDNNVYRRRDPSPRRGGIASLFGIIILWRIRYEPCDAGIGIPCIFPLEQRLGIVADNATLALADRVGKWTAQHTQETVRQLLLSEHRVAWSVDTLRKVVADLSAGLAP